MERACEVGEFAQSFNQTRSRVMAIIDDVYSPDTGEHIVTDNPASWMARAGVAAPAYNPAIEGCFYQNGAWVVVSYAPIPAQLLQSAQTTASKIIDGQAGATRAKYITTVAGQSETYMSKATDATAYKAAGYPFASVASYIWVRAEAAAMYGATATAAQTQAAADGILAAQTAWIALGAKIEQARRAGGVAVDAATTVAAVQAAQAAAVAALAAM
jgi:hypothetical protein